MRVYGLKLSYKDGTNTVMTRTEVNTYGVGTLLCQIFQGETLDNISRIFRNCINMYPFQENELTQDEIEEAERYVIEALGYDDFAPAQYLSRGSIIRCMEAYRALDSDAGQWLLRQEEDRRFYDPRLFSDIGFRTVGEFLRLCYNNYIIDLINGVDLFGAMAAVWSGTYTKEDVYRYRELCSALYDPDNVPGIEMLTSYDISTGIFNHEYVISSFLTMVVFEFSHLSESATKMKRCQNPECGKFFTAKRSSAKYCGFPAPQCTDRVCNDYYPQFVHREKVRTDEMDRLVRNAKGRLYNSRRRHPEYAEEIDGFLSDLTIYAPIKKQEVIENKLTITDFKNWLDSHKKEEEI